ncbi:MAG: GNAT family protein [Phototrophicales bacterium]|nr:MAG: N-acetyltransferase [Chloroflexota bacterium]
MKTLQTKRLYLRSLELADASSIYELMNSREIAARLLNVQYPYTQEAANDFVYYAQQQGRNGKAFIWGIVHQTVLIGMIELSLCLQHHSAEVGYWLGVSFWNQGYATEALQCVLSYAFDELKLHRVYAVCFVDNKASARVLQKVGMQHEGTLRQHYFHWGEYHDVAYFGLLHQDRLSK